MGTFPAPSGSGSVTGLRPGERGGSEGRAEKLRLFGVSPLMISGAGYKAQLSLFWTRKALQVVFSAVSLSIAKLLPAASEGFGSWASSTILSGCGQAGDGGAALTQLLFPEDVCPSGSLGSTSGTAGAGWCW